MKRTARFLKEWLVYVIMASLFLVLFGIITEAMVLGEIRLNWLALFTGFWVTLLVVNWVSGLIGLNFLLFEKVLADWVCRLQAQLDPDGEDEMGILAALLDGVVFTLSFDLLYFTTSPFMSWLLTLFQSGPHQDLFSFYWGVWTNFGWIESWGLLLSSAGVFFGYILVLALGLEKKRYDSYEFPR